MIGFMYLKELILIKQMHQKNVLFVFIGILKILVLSMKRIFAMAVMIWSIKLWILMMVLFFLLKEVIREFIFDIRAKMSNKYNEQF